jgi:hypothetical protein
LSESRIPVAAAEAEAKANVCEEAFPALGLESPSEHISEEDLRQRLRLTDSNDALLKSSWIYIGYYSQLMHRFQAQELLRQFALQHQRDTQNEKVREAFQLLIVRCFVFRDELQHLAKISEIKLCS